MKNILYDVDIIDGIAQVEITMDFVNKYDHSIETEYMFPISVKSVFHKFETIFEDGTVYVGKVKEKSVAKQEYMDSVS